jgi:hypothetical protein
LYAEAAKRPDSYLDARSTQKTLVIDYQFLAMLPPTSMPRSRSSAAPPPVMHGLSGYQGKG